MGALRYIRIVAMPIGEAPAWVRRKWIGLELPVLDHVPVTMDTTGVLTSGESSWMDRLTGVFRRFIFQSSVVVTGYVAPIDACIAILAEHHPDAAAWWRANTPYLLDREEWWIFDEPACELIPLPGEPPAGFRA